MFRLSTYTMWVKRTLTQVIRCWSIFKILLMAHSTENLHQYFTMYHNNMFISKVEYLIVSLLLLSRCVHTHLPITSHNSYTSSKITSSSTVWLIPLQSTSTYFISYNRVPSCGLLLIQQYSKTKSYYTNLLLVYSSVHWTHTLKLSQPLNWLKSGTMVQADIHYPVSHITMAVDNFGVLTVSQYRSHCQPAFSLLGTRQ